MNKIKKILIGTTTAGLLFSSLAGGAFANGTQYDNNPGRLQAGLVGAQCGTGAGSGAFQFFEGTPGAVHEYVLEDKALGVSLGSETGPANSAICGNNQ